jgi:hypothetical protein
MLPVPEVQGPLVSHTLHIFLQPFSFTWHAILTIFTLNLHILILHSSKLLVTHRASLYRYPLPFKIYGSRPRYNKSTWVHNSLKIIFGIYSKRNHFINLGFIHLYYCLQKQETIWWAEKERVPIFSPLD